MENLACIVVVFAFYCAWACAKYHDRPFSCPPDPIAPVDYFPDADKEAIAYATDMAKGITEPEPIVIVERRPVAAFTTPVAPAMATESDLMTQSIRTLKSLAKGRVNAYSNLTKSQLSQRLAGIVPLSKL